MTVKTMPLTKLTTTAIRLGSCWEIGEIVDHKEAKKGIGNEFEIVCLFKDSDVLSEIAFMNAAKRTEKVT